MKARLGLVMAQPNTMVAGQQEGGKFFFFFLFKEKKNRKEKKDRRASIRGVVRTFLPAFGGGNLARPKYSSTIGMRNSGSKEL